MSIMLCISFLCLVGGTELDIISAAEGQSMVECFFDKDTLFSVVICANP